MAKTKLDPEEQELLEAYETGEFESDLEFTQLRRMGRPKAAVTKERVTICLSPEVLEHFRSQGPGWQTRIDEVLKELVHEQHQ